MTDASKLKAINFGKNHPKLSVCILLILMFAGYLLWPLSESTISTHGINSTRIVDRNGNLLREIRPLGSGIPISLKDVDQTLVDAVVAIEDRHFFSHFGINPVSIFRAWRDNAAAGEIVRGGSTLTMQVARTLRGNKSRNIYQKIAEAFLALRLETQLSKEDILTTWLNKVYFGNQAYGIEAASQLYFNKSAADLNLGEATFLAGLPQRPNAFDPYRNLDNALLRQRRVLDAMFIASFVTRTEIDQVEKIPLQITARETVFKAPHFVEDIRRRASANLTETREIQTTLDLPLQHAVESLASAHLERLGNDRASNAAAIVIDNKTGDILAYMGSVDFWNTSIEGQNDGVRMLRQPGSALKPFTYAVALDSKKYTPASILPDIEVHIPEAGGAFSPLNYDKKFHGPVPLRTALASSYNIPAVRLLREYGTASLLDVLFEAGIQSLNKGPDHYGVGLTLGNGEVRLIELAQAYTTFARQGQSISPNPVRATVSLEGDTLRQSTVNFEAVFEPEVTYLVTDILADPEARAPAFGRHGPLELPFPVAVKTGTSKDYRDNWAVGYTPRHTVAVWVGNFDGKPMRRVSGVSGAGPLFHAIMLHLGSGGNFGQPAGIHEAMICPVSGNMPGAHCPGVKKELFLPGTLPTDTCTTHQVFVLDERDGSLAHVATPAEHIQPTLFTVFDEQFLTWAKSNGIPSPPQFSENSDPNRDEATPNAEFADASPLHVSDQLRITYPESGMTFQLDPVLHASYQRIKLQGIVRDDLLQPTWWIDDRSFAGALDGAFWPLKEGTHEIELRARNKQGQLVRSAPVIVQVLPYNGLPVKPATPTSTSASR